MKSIREALETMVSSFAPLGAVRCDLLSARGAVLAEDVHARRDLPAFDNSAMDGYAVRHGDLPPPDVTLPVAGESRAGEPAKGPLERGTAVRIFTGAPLPEGADTVVMQENVERQGDRIRIVEAPRAGAHVRRRGSDMTAGSLALPGGTALGPGEIGLLAAQGHHAASVHRAPRVAILSTGDELRDIGQDTESGTIVNSNAYALAAQVAEAAAVPWVLPAAPDDPQVIAERLTEGLSADVLLSIGGVSVGEHDHVGEAFDRAGIQTHFWKVAIKPGKPLLFGTGGGVPVVGLPGNPISAMVIFEIFVRPGLARMRGHRAPYPTPIAVTLAHDHRHSPGRTELARATLCRSEGGLAARMHALQGSGSLPSMVGVDALVVLPAGREHFPAGTAVEALPRDRRLPLCPEVAPG